MEYDQRLEIGIWRQEYGPCLAIACQRRIIDLPDLHKYHHESAMVSFDPISKYLHHLNRNAEINHVTSGVTRPTGQGAWCLELESHYHDLEQGTGNMLDMPHN